MSIMWIYHNHAELTAAMFKQWSLHSTDKMHIKGGDMVEGLDKNVLPSAVQLELMRN